MLFRLFMLFFSAMVPAFGLHAYGQMRETSNTVHVRFAPTLGAKPLSLVNEAQAVADSISITTFRCYISGLSLWHNGQLLWQETESYHLLDAAFPESLTIALHPPAGIQYSTFRFNLGIDSATSCSGVHGGDLDPVKGMYWAWQSGYINFKLEGNNPVCPTRKHAFQYHLGGYQYPYLSIQPVSLEVKQGKPCVIKMDIGQFLEGIDMASQHTIMIPGAKAAALSRRASKIFQVQQ